jgi:hypothetical protein
VPADHIIIRDTFTLTHQLNLKKRCPSRIVRNVRSYSREALAGLAHDNRGLIETSEKILGNSLRAKLFARKMKDEGQQSARRGEETIARKISDSLLLCV